MAVPLYCSCGRGRWGLRHRAPGTLSPAPWAPAPAHLYMLHGLGSGRGLQQGHSAATKATTCHAAAINPRHRERGLHQLVQLRTAHLIVIPAEDGGGGVLDSIPPSPGDSQYAEVPCSQGGLT